MSDYGPCLGGMDISPLEYKLINNGDAGMNLDCLINNSKLQNAININTCFLGSRVSLYAKLKQMQLL